VTAYPTWTPASRPGIIPLQPLGFGTVLGRSFSALRHNPRVLLGFALVVQVLATLLVVAVVAGTSFWAFSRLQNIPTTSPDYDTITAGSIAIVLVVSGIAGLVAAGLQTLVQAVVVQDVARGAVAERAPLRELWQNVKPVLWRLIGYTLLVTAALILGIAIVVGIVIGVSMLSPVAGILFTVLAVLGAIPLLLWLSTKLMLTAPVIVIEHATIRGGIARSWRLSRRRFWPMLGVLVIVQAIFSAVSYAISMPFSLLGSLAGAVIAPTGDADTQTVITLVVALALPEMVSLVIGSVAAVVQATAASLLYIDARMRKEGLDLDLLAYVEQRDAGGTGLPDPYRLHVGREMMRAPVGYMPGAYPPAYGQPQYGQPAYGQPAYGHPAYGQPAYGQPAAYPPPPYPPQLPERAQRDDGPVPPYAPPAPPAQNPPDPTQWTAPGGPTPPE